MLLKELIEFGLSEKEAKVYLTLLELEIAPVQDVAKAAGTNRSSTYVTLESLKKRGLVGISDDKKVRQYIATSPETILRTAEDMSIKQENIRRKIEAIIPDMKALYKGTKQKPLLKVFEGKQGLINALAGTLETREKIVRVCSSAKMLFEVIPDFLPLYGKKRVELNVELKAIFPLTDASNNLISVMPKLYKAVYIPENKYMIPADIAIWDNKLAYSVTQGKEITCIIIESQEITGIMKAVFDMAFNEAGRIGIKKSSK